MVTFPFRSAVRLTFVLAACAALACGGRANADPVPTVPPKDAGGFFTTYGLGSVGNDLFLHTGDSIYKLNRGTGDFDAYMTGLRSAFGGARRTYEGSFAVSPTGTALVTMGYTDGGALLVDLLAKTTTVVTGFETPGDPVYAGANLYSSAARADGAFFTMRASQVWDASDMTKVYSIAPGTLAVNLVKDVAPGEYSGGMAFDAAGNLIASTFVPNFADPGQGLAKFYRIAAADLALFEANGTTPAASFIGSGHANGDNALVVGPQGDVFFSTATGVGVLPAGATQAVNYYGDITDPNVFTIPTTNVEGLGFDTFTGKLLVIERPTVGGTASLLSLPAPEPGTGLAVALFAAALLRRRGAARR